ncbi:hypothetical protein NEOLEDRAFT_1143463 [Neolentinus lepideus HHB14362 ss-1]|uniref:Uncharacterized protein n=1 Tax=Neolentinus lepideus HHB14362 ss-1 TaxID=1314782 RepID=A0A165MIW7_9AGAM|nr:hypothetical protein NEOLEDRAFT_1143463 [Neolentinus lepideus HHB14362 ss-1]
MTFGESGVIDGHVGRDIDAYGTEGAAAVVPGILNLGESDTLNVYARCDINAERRGCRGTRCCGPWCPEY